MFAALRCFAPALSAVVPKLSDINDVDPSGAAARCLARFHSPRFVFAQLPPTEVSGRSDLTELEWAHRHSSTRSENHDWRGWLSKTM